MDVKNLSNKMKIKVSSKINSKIDSEFSTTSIIIPATCSIRQFTEITGKISTRRISIRPDTNEAIMSVSGYWKYKDIM